MSFMNKVKNFFYEDVEEDEIEEVVKEKPKKENKIDFKSFLKKEERIEDEEPEREEVVQKANNDLSERELFRSERTFNFPMDLGDEIFDEEKEPTRNVYERKEPTRVTPQPQVKPAQNTSSIYRNISTETPKTEGPKHFRPSPVISPVYGILDKNYTVDDVVEKDLNKTKEFSIEKKMVDFDTVRNRAYKELDEEIEKTLTGDIFYNLDEEDTKPSEEGSDIFEDSNDSVIITYNDEDGEEVTPIEEPEDKTIPIDDLVKEEEPEITEPEIKTTVETEEDEDDDLMPDVKIKVKEEVKPKRKTKKKEEPKEEKEDLFNLIDNMYSEDDEEEEE